RSSDLCGFPREEKRPYSGGAPIEKKVPAVGDENEIRCPPEESSIVIELPPPVWILHCVLFDPDTGLAVSGLIRAPRMSGRSGSPSTKPSATSVPLWRGKCMPMPPPA